MGNLNALGIHGSLKGESLKLDLLPTSTLMEVYSSVGQFRGKPGLRLQPQAVVSTSKSPSSCSEQRLILGVA